MSDPAVTVIALLVTGYLLLAVEAFVIPGFGAAGIAGFVCLALGCWLAFRHFGSAYGALTIVLVLSSVTIAMWWIPKTRFGRSVVQSETLARAKSAETELAPGDIGIAESDLRPAGVARFGELRESVVTEGEYITAGSKVCVTEVHGSRIVVEAVPAADQEPA